MLDVLLLWWMALGFRLAWKKGSYLYLDTLSRCGPDLRHEWIGIQFFLRCDVAIMSLTQDFLDSTRAALRPFMQRHGEATTQVARTAVGKCARVAQVVSTAEPFSAAL